MKIANRTLKPYRSVSQCLLAAAILASLSISLAAQQPAASSTDVQREAMQKLSFLVGHWSGPISVSRGPGEPVKLTQTEEIQYKLDGLVMLIEGTSRDAEGKTSFNALATVSFDDTTHNYRFRAYNGGHYIDTELTVITNGFSWSYDAGPAHIVNAMHLTAKGEWSETTDVTVGGNPPHHSVEMLLQHQL
jgi:hypothetical protein